MVNVDVFISYSSKNKSVADAVVSDFEQNGIRCWYAPRDIMPGTEWVTAIQEGIRSAKVFVLLFTEESNNSRQVMNEVALAFNAEKTIVPFKLTKEEMSDELEYYLTRVHWLDAVSEPLNAHIVDLRKYVEIILSGAAPHAAENREQGGRKKRGLLLGSILAVLAIAAVVLLIWKPFGSDKKPTEDGGHSEAEGEKDEFFEDKKLGDACYEKGEYGDALAHYLKSMEHGNTDTSVYYRIAQIYLTGKIDDEASEEKGLQYLEKAYNGGSGEKLTADEYYRLAYQYDADPDGKDPAKVYEFARKGAEAGSVPCMVMVGEAYWYGRGVEQDYEQMLVWFGKALDSGAEGYTRNYCIASITSLVDEGHVSREAAAKWIGDAQ
ncbi:MAG: toll/interleukin-1 receptor domain-containing protein [Lachnospiraceae bacterium]|nr:toll/interleukin-1 receptor domain-containing protein [Lachnospiraceae bacterium]